MNLTPIAASAVLAVSFFVNPVTSSVALANELVTPSPEGAQTYIVWPEDGATVDTTFKVVFGLSGMGIAPAGVERENTGHHHLLINQEELPAEGVPMGNPPLHFGSGQTETEVTLGPGTHTLQIILGNHFHVPHNPPVVSEKITITVVENTGVEN